MKPNLNYQQLQEMAKEIPEGIPEEISEESTKQMAEEEMASGDRNVSWLKLPIKITFIHFLLLGLI